MPLYRVTAAAPGAVLGTFEALDDTEARRVGRALTRDRPLHERRSGRDAGYTLLRNGTAGWQFIEAWVPSWCPAAVLSRWGWPDHER